MDRKRGSARCRAKSGRIVINVGPEFKAQMYATLDRSDLTMKEWFIAAATNFCDDQEQPGLFSKPRFSNGMSAESPNTNKEPSKDS